MELLAGGSGVPLRALALETGDSHEFTLNELLPLLKSAAGEFGVYMFALVSPFCGT